MYASLKKLWPFMRPMKRELITMFILGALLSLVGGILPFLVQVLVGIYQRSQIDQLVPAWVLAYFPINDANLQILSVAIPIAFPVLFLLQGILKYLHYAILNYSAERIVANIRVELLRKIMRLNLTYHGSLERGSGGLISRVFNDTQLLQQGLNFYVDLIREPFRGLVYLGTMLWIDWKLTLGALVFLPIFLLITKQASRSLRKYGKIGRDSMEDLTSALKETVDGVRVVQSFNLEGEMEFRFREHLVSYLSTAKKIVTREQAVSPLNEFVISFLLGGFAFYSIQEVLYHNANGAKFLGFVIAAGLFQAPIKTLQDAGIKLQQSIVVTDRVFSILESPSEVPQSKNPKPFPKDWRTIEFKDVSFAYAGELTLKNISLTVKRGEVIALVGESGSGKSTLVNLLERFYEPTSGEILIDGVSTREIALEELRSNIALVTQDVFLFRDTIARNIEAGRIDAREAGRINSGSDSAHANPTGALAIRDAIRKSAQLANADTFINRLPQNFDSPVGERGSFLSGGEKQRISIARAIFKNAPILILDEATSALDSVSEMEVQKGLQHLMEGRTAFVIAHRLSTVFNADRILVMKRGEIVEQGSHTELLAHKGEYLRFFELQVNQGERVRQST